MKASLFAAMSFTFLLFWGETLKAEDNVQTVSQKKCVSTPASIPFNPNEISLNYGRFSLPGIAMNLGASLGITFSFGLAKIDEFYSTGAIGLDYFHYFNRNFAIGGSAVFEDFHFRWAEKSGEDESGDSAYEPGSSTDALFISVLPGIKWRWLYRPHFGMYTKAGIGAMIQGNDASSLSFIFQLSPVGMEFGSEKVRGFIEAGIGTQGMFVGGIRTAF